MIWKTDDKKKRDEITERRRKEIACKTIDEKDKWDERDNKENRFNRKRMDKRKSNETKRLMKIMKGWDGREK